MRSTISLYQYDLCLHTAYGTISRTAAYMRTLPGRASNFMSMPLSYNTLCDFCLVWLAYIEVHAFSLNDLHTITDCISCYLFLQILINLRLHILINLGPSYGGATAVEIKFSPRAYLKKQKT